MYKVFPDCCQQHFYFPTYISGGDPETVSLLSILHTAISSWMRLDRGSSFFLAALYSLRFPINTLKGQCGQMAFSQNTRQFSFAVIWHNLLPPYSAENGNQQKRSGDTTAPALLNRKSKVKNKTNFLIYYTCLTYLCMITTSGLVQRKFTFYTLFLYFFSFFFLLLSTSPAEDVLQLPTECYVIEINAKSSVPHTWTHKRTHTPQ